MATFGITPVTGFPQATGDEFPRFIQFQQDGEDVGTTVVETLNFTGDVALTLSSDGGTVTVDVDATPSGAFTWRSLDGDGTLEVADIANGITSTGTSGTQNLTIPAGLSSNPGDAILVHQGGGAAVTIVADGGVNLRYRSAAFNPKTAGDEAVLSIINFAADDWIICGDLEAL